MADGSRPSLRGPPVQRRDAGLATCEAVCQLNPGSPTIRVVGSADLQDRWIACIAKTMLCLDGKRMLPTPWSARLWVRKISPCEEWGSRDGMDGKARG